MNLLDELWASFERQGILKDNAAFQAAAAGNQDATREFIQSVLRLACTQYPGNEQLAGAARMGEDTLSQLSLGKKTGE